MVLCQNFRQVILEIITWVQENGAAYFNKENIENENSSGHTETNGDCGNDEYCFWVYIHHIYSKYKRRNIVSWAREYNLTGFLMAGKPGVIYVEGILNNIEEYCVKVRGLNWKKMTCKVKGLRRGFLKISQKNVLTSMVVDQTTWTWGSFTYF